MQVNENFFDNKGVCYQLISENDVGSYNWIFLPGGPGADSSYFHTLTDLIELPGKVWLIDLPGNGNNHQGEVDFESWYTLFPKVVERFDNPVIVSHSFSSMLVLSCPTLKKQLSGLVILNSAPSCYREIAEISRKQSGLPDCSKAMAAYPNNPCEETFRTALEACVPYHFHGDSIESGKEFLLSIPFNWHAPLWWSKKIATTRYSAKWIPDQEPVMIIGGTYDRVTPPTIFEQDARFQRPNISIHRIEKAGHWCWIDDPENVRSRFKAFVARLP